MALEKFSLDALRTIDNGRIAEAFAQALFRLESDCKDRPALKDARKVSLIATLTPVPTDSGELASVDVSFQIKDSVPKRQSAVYNMKATQAGLFFNELSPDDIAQATIDQVRSPQPAFDPNTGELLPPTTQSHVG